MNYYKNLPPLSLSIDLAYRTTNIEGELDFTYSPFKNLVKKDGSLNNFRTSEISLYLLISMSICDILSLAYLYITI